MDSNQLNLPQLAAIHRTIDRQLDYFYRLQIRMLTGGWPDTDIIRGNTERVIRELEVLQRETDPAERERPNAKRPRRS